MIPILAFLGLCVTPQLRAAPEALRLDEVAIARFTAIAPGQWSVTHGLLSALGQFREIDTWSVLSTVTVPPEALNKDLITFESWLAYQRLSPEAVANFLADEEGPHHLIGQRIYLEIAAHPDPARSHGKLANFSSRGFVAPDRAMIGGLVIDDQPRWVLIRAVGPTLGEMGVQAPLSNPTLTLFRGPTAILANDDWGIGDDAAQLAAAAVKVGAFALPLGSLDAALLVKLPPGAYTAHAATLAGGIGEVLLEIYSVPQ